MVSKLVSYGFLWFPMGVVCRRLGLHTKALAARFARLHVVAALPQLSASEALSAAPKRSALRRPEASHREV